MIKRFLILTLSILFFIMNSLCGQSTAEPVVPNPIFTSFEGTVYDMPEIEKAMGKGKTIGIQDYYSDAVYHYDSIGFVSLEEININETRIKEGGFPGISQRTKIAMLLDSKMEITLAACYEFSLSSDDGSKMWINEQEIINNDGGHMMQTEKDTIALNPGTYDVKLWYFQGLPDRFGFIFDAKIKGRQNACHKILDTIQPINMTLSSIHFDVNQAKLKPTGVAEIGEMSRQINTKHFTKITIIGHTDRTGNSDYNIKLSEERAIVVMEELKKRIKDQSIIYITIGNGSSSPIDDTDTIEGRALNRRVEIILE